MAVIIVGCEKLSQGHIEAQREHWLRCILVFIIDSREYIFSYDMPVHKGNCKFCAERRKQELKELIRELKENNYETRR